MASVQQFQEALQQIDAETTRIGNKIQELTEQLKNPGISQEEEASVLQSLNAAANRLKAVGVSVDQPVPDPEPEV